MNFWLLITFFTLAHGCVKGSEKKAEFRANVTDNRTVIDPTASEAASDFDIELETEKEKLKEVILRSEHKTEVKEQAVEYINNFDYSKIKNMKDFMEVFLTGLMEILPNGVKETLDVAVDSTIIAANSPVKEDDSNIKGLKQDILKEVVKRTSIQKSISESDIRAVVAEAVQKSGYWEEENADDIIARVNEEILSEPEIKDALTQKAVKLTMDGCVDPDLTTLLSTSNITLCDGTQAIGTLEIPTVPPECDSAGQEDCIANSDFATYDKATCTNPDLSKIATTETVILCDGSTAQGTYTIPTPIADCSAAGELGCKTVSNFPPMDLSSASISSTADLNPTDFNNLLQNSLNFQYWDKSGTRYTGSGDTDLIPANLKDSIDVFGVEGGYSGAPSAPTGLSASRASATQMDLAWDDAGVSGYLLVVNQGSAVTFTPTDGQSYTTGSSITGGSVVYSGSATSGSNSSVTDGNTYHFALYAHDPFYNYSSPLVFEKNHNRCSYLLAGTWVLVPGDTDYSTSDFCVMKYEAKNVLDAPESNAAGSPWVDINQTDSITECQSLGAGYDLISNPQWMTLATNIADTASNWDPGPVGTGTLNRGHSDNNPSQACPASTNDLEAWVEGSCTPLTSGGDADIEKRTHTLSTGEVIWDLAGNVWEWTSASGLTNKPYSNNGWEEYTSGNFSYGGASIQENELISQAAITGNWDSTEGIGQIYPGTNGSGGSLLRGAYWNVTARSGVFAAGLNNGPTITTTGIGFRCVAAAP